MTEETCTASAEHEISSITYTHPINKCCRPRGHAGIHKTIEGIPFFISRWEEDREAGAIG